MRRIISSIVLFVMLFTSIGTTNAFALSNDPVNETQNNLEYQQHTVSEAVYQDDSSIKVFDYALYSGSSTSGLNINSSKTDITGDVHTNQNFIYRGSTLKVSGACGSVGVVDTKGPKIEIDDIKENALFIEMPDIVSDIKEVVTEDAEVFNQNKKYNGSNINLDKSIIVNGSVTFNGAKLNTKGYIIAKDNISFNTAKISCENSKGIVICSENGDITINSSTVELNGILYAPKVQSQLTLPIFL